MSSGIFPIPVAEVMSLKVYSISADEPIERARKLMQSKHFGGLPVVENNQVVGIVTMKDTHKQGFLKGKVRDVMTKEVVSIAPEEKLPNAHAKMSRLGVMRLPVITRDNQLVGMLTLTDIERAQRILQKRTIENTNCRKCGHPLSLSISETVVCEYCKTPNSYS